MGMFDFNTDPWTDSALVVNSSPWAVQHRDESTQTMNAAQAMQQPVDSGSSGWTDLLKDAFKGAVSYQIAKDAQKNQVAVPQYVYQQGGQGYQQGYAQPNPNGGGLLLLLLVGAVVFAMSSDGAK